MESLMTPNFLFLEHSTKYKPLHIKRKIYNPYFNLRILLKEFEFGDKM